MWPSSFPCTRRQRPGQVSSVAPQVQVYADSGNRSRRRSLILTPLHHSRVLSILQNGRLARHLPARGPAHPSPDPTQLPFTHLNQPHRPTRIAPAPLLPTRLGFGPTVAHRRSRTTSANRTAEPYQVGADEGRRGGYVLPDQEAGWMEGVLSGLEHQPGQDGTE